MVGEPLELERHAPQDIGASRDPDAPQRLERLTVRRRMADRGVARERLHVVDGALVRAAGERPLHAAVLVAERDLQVQDVLAVALKTEMSGLDDPGVHGADGDLVHLLAFDPEEIHDARRTRSLLRARTAIATRQVRPVNAAPLQ